MSEKTVRVCDVCGRVFKDVAKFTVEVVQMGDAVVPRTDKRVDLCPAHLTRLLGFVARGCSPLKGKP